MTRPRRAPERLMSEAGAALEYFALQADPVFYGIGVPRGDGAPVVVLPGLFANDGYLLPLRLWLRRIGYKPIASSLPVNAGCMDRLLKVVTSHLDREAGSADGLRIIGHSRGGILGWALAAALQQRVSRLILLGSPAPAVVDAVRSGVGAGIPAGTSQTVADASLRARRYLDPECEFPACGCEFARLMTKPLSKATLVTAIISTTDPIVPAAAASVAAARTHRVSGTHSGLPVNPAVYRLLGPMLAD